MPVFVYQAADKNGKLVEGTMEAKDEHVIVNRLYNTQLRPISVTRQKTSGGLQQGIRFSPFSERVRGKDILGFTQKLSSLLNAGLTLDRSLTIMIELNEREKMRRIVENIRKSVHGGSSFADAISKYPHIFSKLYVSMIKAGEEGAVLEIILERLAGFLESTERLRENIISAMIYPAVLSMAGGVSVMVLMTFVIPKFARIFSDMGQAIPLPTMILLDISTFFSSYWWMLIAAAAGAFLLVKTYSATESGKLMIHTLLLKIPVLGSIVRMIQVSRFTKTLGTLVKSGVPILKAVSITGETLTNVAMARSMDDIYKGIRGGVGISEPMKQSGIFPPLAVNMVQVGEETGNLEEMLIKVGNTYEGEIENSVKRLITLLEPIMILGMGLVIAFIVISILLAIFSMNDLPM